MHISFSPQRRDDALELVKTGDKLRINGEMFNFGPLNEGDEIPSGEVPSEWIIGPVTRKNGLITLTVLLPHGPNPSSAVAFPAPVTVDQDGPIAIPFNESTDDVDA